MHLVDFTMFYAAESGGVRTYLRSKARWLAARGQVVHTVVAPAMAGQVEGDASVVSVPSIPIPFSNGYRVPRSVGAAARKLRQLKPDLVEVGDPYHSAWAALRARRELRAPVIGFYHSDLPCIIGQRFGARAQGAAARYVGHLYRQFDLVLAPSLVMVRRLHELGIERVRHQPLGVDTTIFDPARRDPDLRRQFGLPDNARLLVYAGRFTREKKLHLLLEAVEALGAPYHLLMIGSGDAGSIPGVSASHVTCLPFERDPHTLARLLASCDALVHPGDQETFGLVVLEALASGLPVVGMRAGGVAELVTPDVGLLVEPGCAGALAAGIAAIYRTDRKRLAINARRLAVEQYDWDVIIPQLFRHYTGLINTPLRTELRSGAAYAGK